MRVLWAAVLGVALWGAVLASKNPSVQTEKMLPPWLGFKENRLHFGQARELRGILRRIQRFRRAVRSFGHQGAVEVGALTARVNGFLEGLRPPTDVEQRMAEKVRAATELAEREMA